MIFPLKCFFFLSDHLNRVIWFSILKWLDAWLQLFLRIIVYTNVASFRLHEINLLLDENYHTVPIIYRHLYIDCIFTPCNVPKYQELHGRKVIMCLSLNQSVALMPSCIDVTILCRNNINQYSLYASKLSAGTIFIKGQYSSQYMAQKRNLSIYYFKLKKY